MSNLYLAFLAASYCCMMMSPLSMAQLPGNSFALFLGSSVDLGFIVPLGFTDCLAAAWDFLGESEISYSIFECMFSSSMEGNTTFPFTSTPF